MTQWRSVQVKFLCLCDANVMFRPDALRHLYSRLNDPGVGAVTGDVRLASEESDFGAEKVSTIVLSEPCR